MKPQAFECRTQRLGPLLLVNHYLDRLGLADVLEGFVSTPARPSHPPALPRGPGHAAPVHSHRAGTPLRTGGGGGNLRAEGSGLTEEQAHGLAGA
jgi:hypothetical protein